MNNEKRTVLFWEDATPDNLPPDGSIVVGKATLRNYPNGAAHEYSAVQIKRLMEQGYTVHWLKEIPLTDLMPPVSAEIAHTENPKIRVGDGGNIPTNDDLFQMVDEARAADLMPKGEGLTDAEKIAETFYVLFRKELAEADGPVLEEWKQLYSQAELWMESRQAVHALSEPTFREAVQAMRDAQPSMGGYWPNGSPELDRQAEAEMRVDELLSPTEPNINLKK